MKIPIFILLILLIFTFSGFTTEAKADGIMPFIMFPLFMNQNNGTDAFTNYMMWAIIFNQPPFYSSIYNSYSTHSTYTTYVSESENGWSLKSPIEYEVVENSNGELVSEEVGFVEPDYPEGYEQDYMNDGLSPEDAMNEAESSNVVSSSEGVEDSVSDVDIETGGYDNSDSGGFDSGDSGGFDSGGFGGE